MSEPLFKAADEVNDLLNRMSRRDGMPTSSLFYEKVIAMVWFARTGKPIGVEGNASNTD